MPSRLWLWIAVPDITWVSRLEYRFRPINWPLSV
jgi:hypothetical protein